MAKKTHAVPDGFIDSEYGGLLLVDFLEALGVSAPKTYHNNFVRLSEQATHLNPSKG